MELSKIARSNVRIGNNIGNNNAQVKVEDSPVEGTAAVASYCQGPVLSSQKEQFELELVPKNLMQLYSPNGCRCMASPSKCECIVEKPQKRRRKRKEYPPTHGSKRLVAQKSKNPPKERLPFEGTESVQLQDCLGKWIVALDVIVTDMGVDAPYTFLSKGCQIEFKESGQVVLESAGEQTKDYHLAGTLDPTDTVSLPVVVSVSDGGLQQEQDHQRFLRFTWTPPPGKSCPGYSDCWKFAQKQEYPISVLVESHAPKVERFPLNCTLFWGDEKETYDRKIQNVREELPEGITMTVHWCPKENFAVKEHLYLCRPENVQAADNVLFKYGGAFDPQSSI